METKYYVLDPSDPEDKREWDRAWDIAVPGDDKAETHNYESWQYMGSSNRDQGDWRHEFRHRCHPSNDKRMYRSVAASGRFIFQRAGGK
jgi:hypothetical protein